MRLIQFIRRIRIWLHYRRAAFVSTREELEDAMRRTPPRIVVDGDEALRAFAAALIIGEKEPAPQSRPDSTAYLVVPPVGRVRNTHRKPAKRQTRTRPSLKGGADIVLVAVLGIFAALTAEWLSFPTEPHLVERPHSRVAGKLVPHAAAPHVLEWVLRSAIMFFAAIAVASFAWVAWQALGLGRPLKTSWRIEYRIHGRLVMARVRQRAA